MINPIVLVVLLGFSICMVVGLITLLQDVVNQNSVRDLEGGPVISDQGAER